MQATGRQLIDPKAIPAKIHASAPDKNPVAPQSA